MQTASVFCYTTCMIQHRMAARGFALPTIVIATVILFMVLVATISSATSTSVALDNQYYQQLAKDAAESGLAHAQDCLNASGLSALWTGTELHPDTTCAGGVGCTGQAKCYVIQTSTFRSTYTVDSPVSATDNGVKLQATGKVELLRTSTNAVWKTYTAELNQTSKSTIDTDNVVMGGSGDGVYISALGKDGQIWSSGINNYGQLGNGSTSTALNPVRFNAPTTSPFASISAHSSGMGGTLFGITADGNAYGAGINNYGQLGNGTFTSPVSTPTLFILPGGKTARKVVSHSSATFVITTDGNVYAAGACANGLLGYNYTISGCSNQSTPQRVALPTPDTSNPNTLPSDNIVVDGSLVALRMQGGRVYVWGENREGQLARGVANGHTFSSTPLQYGDFGNSNSRRATKVVTDGLTVWVMADDNQIYSSGWSVWGQTGNTLMEIYHPQSGKCIDNNAGDGTTVILNACSQGTSQQWRVLTDSRIQNVASSRCLENTNADGYNIQLNACSTNAQQYWGVFGGAVRYYNIMTLQGGVAAGKSLENEGANGTTIKLYPNNYSSGNQNIMMDSPWISRMDDTCFSGKRPMDAAGDWLSLSFLTDSGELFSAGYNGFGAFGTGTPAKYVPTCAKFGMPNGVTATGFGIGSVGTVNLYAIGSDGGLYMAGNNDYGQLGTNTQNEGNNAGVRRSGVFDTNTPAVSVMSSYGTTVVITASGRIYAWGNNQWGQLGNGTTSRVLVPTLSSLNRNTAENF